MAPKKKVAKKKTTKPKKLGLFDHLNAVKSVQDPNYFDKISDDDAKTWSNFMVLKFLSMTEEYIPVANELQKHLNLPPKLMYKTLIDILPKRKTWDKYIKGKNENKYEQWLVDLITTHFTCSNNESIDYLNIFTLTDEGKSELKDLISLYGIEEKEIKKLKL